MPSWVTGLWVKLALAAAAAVVIGWLWLGWDAAAAREEAAELRAQAYRAAAEENARTIEAMQVELGRAAAEVAELERSSSARRQTIIRVQREVSDAGTKDAVGPGVRAGLDGLRRLLGAPGGDEAATGAD